MDYSFPIASARTRQWGVWFENWNRYPFYFDGPQTIFHFEKTFVPNGDALVYFLNLLPLTSIRRAKSWSRLWAGKRHCAV